MAINFPDNPQVNDTYSYDFQTYIWNGTTWRIVRTSAVGPTGPAGPTGPVSTEPGATGPTGPTGAASTAVGPTGPTGPAGTFSITAWDSYTPVWTASSTNPTIGNGTISGRYVAIGATIIGEIRIVGGTVGFSRGSGTYYISLPTAGNAENYQPVGHVVIRDEGPGITYFGTAIFNGGNNSRIELWIHSQSSTYDEGVAAGSEAPIVFSANDKILVQFTYESAL